MVCFSILCADGRCVFLFSLPLVSLPVMVSTSVDVLFPFYLYLTHDWYNRLIVHEEIFSFLIWMHFGLTLALYALYFLQIQTARKIFSAILWLAASTTDKQGRFYWCAD